MPLRHAFSEVTPTRGREAALRWAGTRSSGVPHSVLYLQPSAVTDGTIIDAWEPHGSRVALRLEGFRTLVDDLYEADTYEGSSTYITDAERRWIVEEALARIDDPAHPLYSQEDPAVGLIGQAEELLSLLEFAGVITAPEVERRLSKEGIPALGRELARFVTLVHEVRADGFESSTMDGADPTTKTFRSERFRHVLAAGESLVATELDSTDVVVVGSFRTLSPVERDVVDLLATTFDAGVVLSRVTDATAERDGKEPLGGTPSGADDAIRRIHEWYAKLGFTSATPESSSDPTPRENAAASLYRYRGATGGDGVTVEDGGINEDGGTDEADGAHEMDGAECSLLSSSDISVEIHPTVQGEVRATAREVRSLIGTGVAPEAIVVAPFDEGTYGERLADALREADVPVSVSSSRSFFATTTGKLFEAAIDLGTEPDRTASLVRLLSNPLVCPERKETKQAVVRRAELLESTRVSTLTELVAGAENGGERAGNGGERTENAGRCVDQIDGAGDEPADVESLIRELITSCERFVNASDLDAARRELFDALGTPIADDGITLTNAVGFSRPVRERERNALDRVAEVCGSLSALRPESRRRAANDETETPDVEDLRRALEQVSVDVTRGRESNSVRVCSPAEAAANPAAHVYVPGLTTEHTPSPPRRLAFARPLNEAHPEFEAADPVAGTRYAFAQLLASEAAVTLSAPQRNPDGDPYVLADPLVELERVTGVTVAGDDGDDGDLGSAAGPATVTDVHRSLAAAIDSDATAPDTVATNTDAYDVAVPGANARARLASGVRLAAARAADAVGEYDGHVAPAVVEDLRSHAHAYSPSRLETYADCGFKYHLQYLLDIKPEEEVTLEMNALESGTYVHDVLERFYRSWHADGHDGVTETTLDDAEVALYAVADERLAEMDAHDTVFHDAWITTLFDGLDVPENEYGDPDAAAGLFKRFLRAEVALASRAATPTYFEAHVGLRLDASGSNACSPQVLDDDPVPVPGTDATLRGKIDRIDVTDDGGLVGMDYKTGNTPSERDTIDGHAFQLPAYLLMAEDALGGDPIGASYYQVKPTSSISPHAGTIGGDEDAAHAYWGTDDPGPLRRYQSLTFDTRDEFHAFLHETVPDRIGRIAAAVDGGSFHPTVLDPGTAGCGHCPYRDACDVRHHRRHAVHESLTEANTPQYAPGLDTEGPQ